MYYQKSGMNIKKILLVLFIVAIFCSIGFFEYKNFFAKNNDNIITGNGRVEAREVAISAKFGGKIVELKVNEGDYIKKDQLLAVIDSRALEADIEAQKAKSNEILKQISAVDAEINATNSAITFYTKELNRTKALIKQNFASQLELDKNNNALDKTKAKLNSLIANKNSLQASYKSLLATIKSQEINLSDMKIYSPINGVVLYKLVENGEMISNGGKMFIMYNPDDLYMTIYMPSENAGQVKLGEKATVKLDAYKNKTFPATITFIADNAEFTPKEVETQKERQKLVFRVKLTFDDNSNREAKPGMPGDGYIEIKK